MKAEILCESAAGFAIRARSVNTSDLAADVIISLRTGPSSIESNWEVLHGDYSYRIKIVGYSGQPKQTLFAVSGDYLFVGAGFELLRLKLPELTLESRDRIDNAGILEMKVIASGEVFVLAEQVACLYTKDGKFRWKAHGRDIFTRIIALSAERITVEVFGGAREELSLLSGKWT